MERDEMLRRVDDHYRSFWGGDLDDFAEPVGSTSNTSLRDPA